MPITQSMVGRICECADMGAGLAVGLEYPQILVDLEYPQVLFVPGLEYPQISSGSPRTNAPRYSKTTVVTFLFCRWVQLTVWCFHFNLKDSLLISCMADLLVMNSLVFVYLGTC